MNQRNFSLQHVILKASPSQARDLFAISKRVVGLNKSNDRKMIRKRIKLIMIPFSGMKDRKIELGIIKTLLTVKQQVPQTGQIIFLPSIFLSFECF